jgi:Domain of unknown function (DUF4126)
LNVLAAFSLATAEMLWEWGSVGVLSAVRVTSMPALDSWAVAGTALGLAASSGVNLYLTVLIAGICVRMSWITGYPPDLAVVAHDWVLSAAAALYFVEFCADKIPWVDSVWDTVHSIIRPLGGAYLAIHTLGVGDPVTATIAGLAAGTVTLSTHGTKASTRLVANHSPEPFSNILLSLAEDVFVAGFSWVTLHHPLIALAAVALFMAAFAFVMPKVFRMLVAQGLFVIGRVRSLLVGRTHPERLNDLERSLTLLHPRLEERTLALVPVGEVLRFVVPCVSGRLHSVGRSVRGVVFGTSAGNVWFVGLRNFRTIHKQISFRGHPVEVRRRLILDEVVIRARGPEGLMVLRFDKTRAHLAEQLHEVLLAHGGVPVAGKSASRLVASVRT